MAPIYIGRVILLAALYVLTGKLGLLLAVPPGYATLIWPASGIALGMLVIYGARLWPGVLLGAFAVNAWNSGALLPEPDTVKVLAAALIAAGSTTQALIGRWLIARFVGLPLRLASIRQVVALLAIAGPLTCIVAATIGVGTLYSLDIAARDALAANWVSWWSGDTLGVLVFMPLVLLAPAGRDHLHWRGTALGRVPLAALLLLLLPLGLTFYAWQEVTDKDYQRGAAKFETLATESEKALQNRLTSYGNAMLGSAGFIQGSSDVSRSEWRTYVDTIKVNENFPGISGIGWVQPVDGVDLAGFTARQRADEAPGFTVHPEVPAGPYYVITFVDPIETNRPALGLNLAFEFERLTAARAARDSGHAAITGRVALVQDAQHRTGFLMLYPVYRRDLPTDTVAERRAALRGWTYAPFIASSFLDGLTQTQSKEFRLRIFDGTAAKPDSLIYSSPATPGAAPAFSRRTILSVQQRYWLLVWESTPAFENTERSTNPLYILVGGLLFTALLALLLVVITVRRTETIEQIVGERRFAVPLLVFGVISAASFAIHSQLLAKERGFIARQIEDQASETEARVAIQLAERVASLGRMAARWQAVGGTPRDQWRRDAANHVAQLSGLRTLEWLDAGYHVRWVEPLAGNEKALGLDARFDAQRAAALTGAAERNVPTITPPIDLVQGYPAFIAYLPLRKDDRFDGFIAGVFETHAFFQGALRTEPTRNYVVSVLHGGREYFDNADARESVARDWMRERSLQLDRERWTLRVTPTVAFIDAQQSALPSLVLAAGLLVAALAALSVRYVLISRLKSAHLGKSLALNAGIISNSAHLVIAIDSEYRVTLFNRAAENSLGYRAADVTGTRAIPLFMDAGELAERARSLSSELGETIPMGPQIFTRIPLRDGQETREWTFVRKDGSRFPVSVIITPLRDADGALTGFLGVIEDVTARKEVDRMKSEFTAVVSHELRTPLTSIRGSLGLILGALSSSLPPKVKDLLEIAQSNCERLVLLVNDILDVEKFSAGQMRFDMRVASLRDVTGRAVEANEGYARRFNARIELEPVDESWRVAIDEDRFIQVMSNLLSNAAKYSPAGGLIKVWAEAAPDGANGAVRVFVRDLGPGIPLDFRARIFEKFSQADSSTTREKGGTGLGLHISRRFVEHMQGRIGFESEIGRGTTFWVELPLAA